jgi:hypothetical protein
MNATDWAGFIVALISILGSTALGVKVASQALPK